MDEFLVPKEKVVLVTMSDGTVETSHGSFNDFDDLINGQGVVILVTAVKSAISWREWDLFAEINDLDVHVFALFVDHLQVVFVDLKDEARVLSTVVEDEIASFVAVTLVNSVASCS